MKFHNAIPIPLQLVNTTLSRRKNTHFQEATLGRKESGNFWHYRKGFIQRVKVFTKICVEVEVMIRPAREVRSLVPNPAIN